MIRKKFKKTKILFMAMMMVGCVGLLCATAEDRVSEKIIVREGER